ncbi:MAG TPA: hypothetical protein VM580_23980 [Labilithrix sp.]|nr:hypothetical protein [Labilithrix sp.]
MMSAGKSGESGAKTNGPSSSSTDGSVRESRASNGTKRGSKTDWIVRPHGPLEKLADNLWWAWGSLPGMSLKRSMVLAKRKDGDLVVHNAIALDTAGMRELEAIGEPKYLIVPNAGHRLDAPAFKHRYPNIQVFAPRGGRDAVAKMVKVDGIYEDFPTDEAVRLEMLHGVGDAEGAMIVRSSDGVTIVLNDAVFNMDRKRDPLGFLFTTLLGSAPGPRISRLVKLLFVKDKRALRQDLERFAEQPDLVRLVVAHEKVAKGPDAANALRTAATYL